MQKLASSERADKDYVQPTDELPLGNAPPEADLERLFGAFDTLPGAAGVEVLARQTPKVDFIERRSDHQWGWFEVVAPEDHPELWCPESMVLLMCITQVDEQTRRTSYWVAPEAVAYALEKHGRPSLENWRALPSQLTGIEPAVERDSPEHLSMSFMNRPKFDPWDVIEGGDGYGDWAPRR